MKDKISFNSNYNLNTWSEKLIKNVLNMLLKVRLLYIKLTYIAYYLI